MSDLFPDLENDIFISYRQNDNFNDGWVTDFVNNLKRELQSTLKDKLKIYFDINPCDGLAETDNVDKSLGNKLKSLIFIPVLSRTYCDTDSFAWKHEFLAFNELSKHDRYGHEVILRNGNVVSRILPVRIHDLDPYDMSLLQDVLHASPRSIDFCYRSSGVNRPLRHDDPAEGNVSGISYRNQLNKLANAIREIIFSIRNHEKNEGPVVKGQYLDASLPKMNSVAVLPFVNMSNDPEQTYFSDGISEEIINTLVEIPNLKVAGRTSAFSFRDRNEDLRSIGEKLNVNTLLEGSVRKSGNRIRITAQLIEAETGYHIWSQKFDRDLNDIFIIQDEIARSIVESLKLTLSGQPLIKKERPQTQNVEAYQLYLKGMSYFYKRGFHMFDGLECFKKALSIDPDYALALVGLADSYTMLCFHSYLPPEEAWPKAAQAADHAVRIEAELPEAHNAVAVIAELFERNWSKAERSYLRALELKPSYLQARCWYALFHLLYIKKNSEEAIRQARIAVENDPMSSYGRTIIAMILTSSGLYEEAVQEGNNSIALDRDAYAAWQFSGVSDEKAGNYRDAIYKYKHALDISGRHNWTIMYLINVLMEPTEYQNVSEARYLYTELIAKSRMGYVSPCLLALASATLGKEDDSIMYFRQAIDRHDPFIIGAMLLYASNRTFLNIPEIVDMMKSIDLSMSGFRIPASAGK
jgi:TolB-like protein